MFETVVECLVKRETPLKAYVGRCAVISFDLLLLVMIYILAAKAPVLMFVAIFIIAIGIILTYMVFTRTDLEYEYSFYDGEMRIDKIMHKSARKKLHTFNFGKMDFMAPEGSHHLGGMVSDRKKYDYSAGDEEQVSYIAVLYDENNTAVELKFTPNEELLDKLNKTYPRKVYMD